MEYSLGEYNKFNNEEQWIRITEGCPNNCPYCYEPTEIKVFDIPQITRNKVKVMDMNLLCKPEADQIIKDLGNKRVNNKVVYYELICGVDYRFLKSDTAILLKQARFKNIRIAWDFQYKFQYKIKQAIDMLVKAGYKPNELMIFMVCNWKIPYIENMKKMDLCKVWNVRIADCWFDNQVSPNIKPIHWTIEQIKDFRKRSRKHNHLVTFKIDPDIKRGQVDQYEIL